MPSLERQILGTACIRLRDLTDRRQSGAVGHLADVNVRRWPRAPVPGRARKLSFALNLERVKPLGRPTGGLLWRILTSRSSSRCRWNSNGPAESASKVQRQKVGLPGSASARRMHMRKHSQSKQKLQLLNRAARRRLERREDLTSRRSPLKNAALEMCLRATSADIRRKRPRFGPNLAIFRQPIGKFGRPCWARTSDQRIMSPLL